MIENIVLIKEKEKEGRGGKRGYSIEAKEKNNG